MDGGCDILQLRDVQVELHGTSRCVSVFGSARAAANHVRRHYWNASERWQELEEVFPSGIGYDGSDLQRAYDGYCAQIARVLRAGIALPLHVHTQYVAPGDTRAVSSIGFVGPGGVQVWVDHKAVRTAYRAQPRGKYSLFNQFTTTLLQAAIRADRGLYVGGRRSREAFSESRQLCAPETWDWQAWTLPTYRQWLDELSA